MARSRSIPRKLIGFVRIGRARRALLIEAAWWLLLARLALVLLPFRKVAKWLGTFVAPADDRVRLLAEESSTLQNARVASEVSWAVASAARCLPFRAVCLPRAMAARAMLSRRGVASVMHFGAAAGCHSGKLIEAHAWIDAAGVEVSGYPVAHEFSEIASFLPSLPTADNAAVRSVSRTPLP